jgi:hypothetical protein
VANAPGSSPAPNPLAYAIELMAASGQTPDAREGITLTSSEM